MDTFQALNKLREGSLIRKKGWLKKEFIYLRNGLVFDNKHKLCYLQLPSSLESPYIWEEYNDKILWQFNIGQVIYSNYAVCSNINYEKYVVTKIGNKNGNDYINVCDDNDNHFILFNSLYMSDEYRILV